MRIQLLTIVASVAALNGAAHADFEVRLDAVGQNGGTRANLGAELRPIDLFGELAAVSITARTVIDPSNPFMLLATGQTGTLYADDEGLGVQDIEGSGSKGISGGGGHQNEEVIITFDTLALASSVWVGITEFDPGNGIGNDDDLAIWVELASGESLMFLENDYMGAFLADESEEGIGRIDFGLLSSSGLASDASIRSITLRETNGHTYINGLAFGQIPAPGALALFGLLGLTGSRRRTNRR